LYKCVRRAQNKIRQIFISRKNVSLSHIPIAKSDPLAKSNPSTFANAIIPSEIRNPKSESRNPKQARINQIQYETKRAPTAWSVPVSLFISRFEFVSRFEIQY
jgi:hypothetical protein